MKNSLNIHKAGAVIIKDRHLLVSRTRGKDIFVAPGGKLEEGESTTDAVVRELDEEQGIRVSPVSLTMLGSFSAIAAGHEADQKTVQMDVLLVGDFEGEPTPSAEIEENRYITSADLGKIPLGSIFEHDVIPMLVERGLID